MELKDKVALITGAGSGFGEAIARAYAARGARVVLVDLRIDEAERVAADLGGHAIAIQADVADGAAVRAAVEVAAKTYGAPHIVVNNAGYTHRNGSLLDVDEVTFDRVFAVNVKSIYHMVQAVATAMRDNGGGVMLNIGSVAGIRPRPGLVWYSASKGTVSLLSKALAVELAPWKIRVNTICPVLAITGMAADFMGGEDTPEIRARFLGTIPLGRFCDTSDVAQAAVYLAEADFVTGIELPVDGGRAI
ncbi:MAG: glucose 1-dehydrogenase [Blastocatellia bacterium]